MAYIEAIRKFYEEYYSSIDFKKWQDELSKNIYSYLKPNVTFREDKIVEGLCEVISKQEKYKNLHIKSRIIHGWYTSGVRFDCEKKMAQCELADMVIVSAVTFNRKIILLKTAFIQNKKATKHITSSCSWKIDQKQLFLLKNFPTFIDVSGIFDKGKEITFPNYSGTLGNYGLFTPTGDMVFLTARNVFCHQNPSNATKRTITFDSIKIASAVQMSLENKIDCCCSYCDDCHHCICFNRRNYFAFSNGRNNLPFFNNYSYALDVHEIVKELTYFNIGEPLNVFGRITNDTLYRYTTDLLQSFGYSVREEGHLSYSENNDISYESKANVLFIHAELGE